MSAPTPVRADVEAAVRRLVAHDEFLRKTPWARDKVEGLYLFMLRENRRRS